MRAALLLLLFACSKEGRLVEPPPRPGPLVVGDAAPAVIVLPDAAASCPAQEPTTQVACSGSASCTYGTQPECTAIYACVAGTWRLAGRGTCRGVCPPRGKALPDQISKAANDAPVCIYPDGVICHYAMAPAPCSGVPTPPQPLTWTCASPNICELLNPGDPCSREGDQCGGACCSSGLRCTKGKWEQFFSPCPPSAR